MCLCVHEYLREQKERFDILATLLPIILRKNYDFFYLVFFLLLYLKESWSNGGRVGGGGKDCCTFIQMDML